MIWATIREGLRRALGLSGLVAGFVGLVRRVRQVRGGSGGVLGDVSCGHRFLEVGTVYVALSG
jgi:hypothetical protein